MPKYILIAESGSDISPEAAAKYDIAVVPMHVAFGNETLDDGSFEPERIVSYYREGKKLPRTSGCNPEDFITVFDDLHARYPDAQLVYLAYSAVTTCSYHSAEIAAEGRPYVTLLDTKQVSIGQRAVVTTAAKQLRKNPDMPLNQLMNVAQGLSDRARMCFLPDNLEFLKAGGRVSNAAYLVSGLLGIHPVIEIQDGRLVATEKYRGKMIKLAPKLIESFAKSYKLEKDVLWLVYTVGLPDNVRAAAELKARACGFRRVVWVRANGVITTHGGPAAFGLAGFAEA